MDDGPNRNEPEEGRAPEPEDVREGADAADTTEVEVRGAPDGAQLAARVRMKDNRIRELYEEITASRLAADEARAVREAGEGRIEALNRERGRLRERVGDLEEELRGRRRRREGFERQISRLERELERRDGEISRRDHLLERRAEEIEAARREAGELAARRDEALQTALGRVEGLEKDLEEREAEISSLNAALGSLRDELETERGAHRALAEPANRLRAGIDLFNDSDGRASISALSRTLGQPEVHVKLGDGEESPVLLFFTWRGVTWQTYAADPRLAVEEPRVYLLDSGEDLSGVDPEPPNAHVGPGGRVVLGL